VRARYPAALAVLLCVPLLAAFGQGAQRVVASSSHSGPVNDLAFDEERGLLLSGGDDGTVRVWDAASSGLKAVFCVSHRPVQRLALHPSLPQVAVLVGENLKTDTLCVWDWEQGRELFELNSAQQLMHLGYSPQGGYLAYSRADFRSLLAVDPQNGRPLELFVKGFGIVSFFVVSKNENTVMCYQPSGRITYWDAKREQAILQVRTLPDLSLMRVTPSGRHMLASSGDRLVAVDLLNGSLTADDRLTGILRLAISPAGTEAGALVSDESGPRVRRWAFGGVFLRGLASPDAPAGSSGLVSLAYGPEGLFTGDRAGSIQLLARSGGWSTFARNVYLPLSGLAFRGDTMAAAAREGIFLYTSGFFAAGAGTGAGWEVRRRVLANPFARPVGLDFLDERRLLVWPRDEGVGALAVLDTVTGEGRLLPVAFSAPIQQVGISNRGVIVVEKGGACRILDRDNYQVQFRFLSPSMNKLVFTRGNTLVGGASGASSFGSPLIQIDIHSGETVLIPDPSQFVYELQYSVSTGSLYCLAVASEQGQPATQFLVRSGKGLERRLLLDSFAGEDLGASLAEDASGRVYCSLGYGGVTAWDGSRLALLAPAGGRVARRLAAHGDRLYALNSDSTINVWDQAKPGEPWELHLFQGGSWAAVSPEGTVYASEDARSFLAQS
jgi:hypothetical protein